MLRVNLGCLSMCQHGKMQSYVALTPHNIRSGFARTGIYPVNHDALRAQYDLMPSAGSGANDGFRDGVMADVLANPHTPENQILNRVLLTPLQHLDASLQARARQLHTAEFAQLYTSRQNLQSVKLSDMASAASAAAKKADVHELLYFEWCVRLSAA